MYRGKVKCCSIVLQFEQFFCICHKSPVLKYIILSLEQVTVTPTPSLDYTLTPLSGDQYTSCLCGSERKTLSWTMAPSALGESQAFIHKAVEVEEPSLIC